MRDQPTRKTTRPTTLGALCTLGTLLVLAGLAGAGTQEIPDPSIAVAAGRVTARIAGTPVGAVVEEIGRLAGATVEWQGGGAEVPVWTAFRGLPLGDALDRVLGGRSHLVTLSGGESGHARRIVVLSAAGGDLARIPATFAGAPRTPSFDYLSDGLDPAVRALLEDPEPAVRRRLLAHLEGLAPDDRRRAVVLDRLLADPDPGVRRAALRVQFGEWDTDPRGELPRRTQHRRARRDAPGEPLGCPGSEG
jgi:hypothetical protein